MSRIDPRLASFITAKMPEIDPASAFPGAPPNFGMQVVDHVFTISGQTGLAGQAYLNADEAMMHDPQNAERMKTDCGVTECLEARQRATALLKWQIEPEIDSDDAKELAKQMTLIVKRTPRFMQMRQSLLEALWAGKAGIAGQFASREVGGHRRIVSSYWEPRHGDKLVFRYDRGDGEYKAGQVGIRVSTSFLSSQARSRNQVEYTSQGQVYFLNDFERKTFIVHKHMIEDGPYENPRLAGRIHGVGIRSKIYWTWYAMVECMQRALEYLDRAAFGVELWRYPASNPKAKEKTQEAATRNVSGRNVVLIPSYPGDQAQMYGVEHIEPGLAGVDRLLQVIKDLFQMKIKRYIMGQTLTSEAEATGMGSGVADAHLETFADIVQYDSMNLEETITEDFLRHLQLWNFPNSGSTQLLFKINFKEENVKERLEAIKSGWDMGLPIVMSELAQACGVTQAKEGEEVVFNPQVYAAIKQFQAQQSSQAAASTANNLNLHGQLMQQSVMNHLGVKPINQNDSQPNDDELSLSREAYSFSENEGSLHLIRNQRSEHMQTIREFTTALSEVASRPVEVSIHQEPVQITIDSKPSIVNIEPQEIHISVPDQQAPVVNVTVRDQPTPIINIDNQINVPDQPAAIVNVTTPEQQAPIVNVTVPPQKSPDVNVTVNPELKMPDRQATGATVVRDADGKIIGIEPKGN